MKGRERERGGQIGNEGEREREGRFGLGGFERDGLEK